METWLMIGVVILVLVAVVVVFIVFRTKLQRSLIGEGGQDLGGLDPGVEYEWTSGAPPLVKTALSAGFVILYLGILAVDFFTDNKLFSDGEIWQVGLVALGAFFSALGPLMSKKTYQLTNEGLYEIPEKKGSERKLLFHWSQLIWFKPGIHGFRYYIRTGAPSFAGAQLPFLTKSRRVNCGKNAMLVNSMIMARGIPTSPPGRAEE